MCAKRGVLCVLVLHPHHKLVSRDIADVLAVPPERTELTGMVINAYNTQIDAAPQNGSKPKGRDFASLFEIDYFFGGLIATGK